MTKYTADGPRQPREPREPSKRPGPHAPARAVAARSKPPQPAPSPRKAPQLERGARVRVIKGPFSGKTGVVQELVGRRSARVMLGLLPVQLDLDDLAPSAPDAAARSRQRLTSSHRKPIPARS